VKEFRLTSHNSHLSSYFQTARYLKPHQLFHQIRRRILPPRLITSLLETPTFEKFDLTAWIEKPKSYIGGGRFCFLNREVDLGWPINWEAKGCSHLWQYNLHYFDYLHQPGISKADGLALIRNWIQGNPVDRRGIGWEPYPLSLRLVNWIKFCIKYADSPGDILNSLFLQAINLQRRLEYHLLGNHLWTNGKALWFAGVFLGKEDILRLGRKIVLGELKEQFLNDGGHFELSPMYHALVLEDLLDLVNLCQRSGHPSDRETLPNLLKTADKALAWLKTLIDDEEKIPLLNDSVYGVAPSFKELRSYAERLGVEGDSDEIPEIRINEWTGQNLSGYWVLKHGPFRLIFDTASLGPDYLLGHGHSDMLSVLLDFEGGNVLVDTGVFEYEEGERRLYSRKTVAHNTVVLDDLDQAELWKSFRVGRRGHPQRFQTNGRNIKCSHTGFSIWQKGLTHERNVSLSGNGFEIKDQVSGHGNHFYKAFFHFAPGVSITPLRDGGYLINDHLLLNPWGAEVNLTKSEYYPEFGRVEERPSLVLHGQFNGNTSFGIRCEYSS
jgi:uncharacterized heparinase superfamily protein